MMNTWKRSWIKLWVEMVEDPKVARMPDRLYRRTIEMFLFAGKEGSADGVLPDVKDMAWILHLEENELKKDLTGLVAYGIVEVIKTPDAIVGKERFRVRNFAKRQAAIPPVERKRAERERKSRDKSVTEMSRDQSRDVTQLSRNDSLSVSVSSSISESSNVFRYYEENIGIITKGIADRLIADEQDFGAVWLLAAMDKANRMAKRSLAYVEGILKNWQEAGYSHEMIPVDEPKTKKPAMSTVEEKLRSIP